MVLTSCTDTAREDEFNEWYHNIHIPDLLQTPGIVGGYRYRNLKKRLDGDEPGYLAIYGIESDDPWGLLRKVALEDDRERAAQGRMIDFIKGHLVSAWGLVASHNEASVQREEMSLSPEVPETLLLVLTNCGDLSRENEFNEWYCDAHISTPSQVPGLGQECHYRNLRWKLRESDPKYLALYEVDSEDPGDLLRQVVEEDKRRAAQSQMIDCFKIEFCIAFEHIDP